MFATLGVSALSYGPYAFLNLISPVIAIIYGFTRFKISYLPKEMPQHKEEGENKYISATWRLRQRIIELA